MSTIINTNTSINKYHETRDADNNSTNNSALSGDHGQRNEFLSKYESLSADYNNFESLPQDARTQLQRDSLDKLQNLMTTTDVVDPQLSELAKNVLEVGRSVANLGNEAIPRTITYTSAVESRAVSKPILSPAKYDELLSYMLHNSQIKMDFDGDGYKAYDYHKKVLDNFIKQLSSLENNVISEADLVKKIKGIYDKAVAAQDYRIGNKIGNNNKDKNTHSGWLNSTYDFTKYETIVKCINEMMTLHNNGTYTLEEVKQKIKSMLSKNVGDPTTASEMSDYMRAAYEGLLKNTIKLGNDILDNEFSSLIAELKAANPAKARENLINDNSALFGFLGTSAQLIASPISIEQLQKISAILKNPSYSKYINNFKFDIKQNFDNFVAGKINADTFNNSITITNLMKPYVSVAMPSKEQMIALLGQENIDKSPLSVDQLYAQMTALFSGVKDSGLLSISLQMKFKESFNKQLDAFTSSVNSLFENNLKNPRPSDSDINKAIQGLVTYYRENYQPNDKSGNYSPENIANYIFNHVSIRFALSNVLDIPHRGSQYASDIRDQSTYQKDKIHNPLMVLINNFTNGLKDDVANLISYYNGEAGDKEKFDIIMSLNNNFLDYTSKVDDSYTFNIFDSLDPLILALQISINLIFLNSQSARIFAQYAEQMQNVLDKLSSLTQFLAKITMLYKEVLGKVQADKGNKENENATTVSFSDVIGKYKVFANNAGYTIEDGSVLFSKDKIPKDFHKYFAVSKDGRSLKLNEYSIKNLIKDISLELELIMPGNTNGNKKDEVKYTFMSQSMVPTIDDFQKKDVGVIWVISKKQDASGDTKYDGYFVGKDGSIMKIPDKDKNGSSWGNTPGNDEIKKIMERVNDGKIDMVDRDSNGSGIYDYTIPVNSINSNIKKDGDAGSFYDTYSLAVFTSTENESFIQSVSSKTKTINDLISNLSQKVQMFQRESEKSTKPFDTIFGIVQNARASR